jgi:hypothetical protein
LDSRRKNGDSNCCLRSAGLVSTRKATSTPTPIPASRRAAAGKPMAGASWITVSISRAVL